MLLVSQYCTEISLTIIKYQSFLVVLIFLLLLKQNQVMFKAYPMLLKLSNKCNNNSGMFEFLSNSATMYKIIIR